MITPPVILPTTRREQDVIRVKKGAVLIIEDHADTRGYIHKLLTLEGFIVVSVPNRDAGAKILPSLKVDVILLDYFMDGMSAFKFITLARENNPRVRIVLMTSPDYVETAAQMLGVSEVLAKPVSDEQICRLFIGAKETQPK